MSLADKVLAVNNDLPIRTDSPVHSGKVRSVYWLTAADNARLIEQRGYDVAANAPLAIMVISDRISAFECIWRAEGGLNGVPGKGAALNAISNHWFELFREQGLAAVCRKIRHCVYDVTSRALSHWPPGAGPMASVHGQGSGTSKCQC